MDDMEEGDEDEEDVPAPVNVPQGLGNAARRATFHINYGKTDITRISLWIL